MIFDAMKVIYNKYSCAISGMSREMMKMDGRNSADIKSGKRRDEILKLFKLENDKIENSVLFST